jgi:hypothetical protein
MFEKIGRLAETAANSVSVSRRGFLGRLGQAALAAAAVTGGLLALPRSASAGKTLYECFCFPGPYGPPPPVRWYECGGCNPKNHNCAKQSTTKTAVGTC